MLILQGQPSCTSRWQLLFLVNRLCHHASVATWNIVITRHSLSLLNMKLNIFDEPNKILSQVKSQRWARMKILSFRLCWSLAVKRPTWTDPVVGVWEPRSDTLLKSPMEILNSLFTLFSWPGFYCQGVYGCTLLGGAWGFRQQLRKSQGLEYI